MSRSNPLPDFEDKSKMLDILYERLTGNGDELYYYMTDWSDLRVAQSINPAFKAHHAGAVRRKKFGKLGPTVETAPPPPSRMDILEQRLSRVIDILASNSPRSAQHRRYLLDGTSATAHLDDI